MHTLPRKSSTRITPSRYPRIDTFTLVRLNIETVELNLLPKQDSLPQTLLLPVPEDDPVSRPGFRAGIQGPWPGEAESQAPSPGTSCHPPQEPGHAPASFSAASGVKGPSPQPIEGHYFLRRPLVVFNLLNYLTSVLNLRSTS